MRARGHEGDVAEEKRASEHDFVARPTRSLSVADRLRAEILSGHFAPSERLHEVRLSEILGVSRTPIRAALQILSAEGLLDYAPNRGYAVRPFAVSDIVGAYEIRAVLEGLSARLAAERGLDRKTVEIVEAALADGDRLMAKGFLVSDDRIAYGAINVRFHQAILAAAGSRMLGDVLRFCQRVPPSSHGNVVAFEERDVRRRHDDHHRISEAILSGEAWRAEVLMREHVGSVKSGILRSLAGHGRVDGGSPAEGADLG